MNLCYITKIIFEKESKIYIKNEWIDLSSPEVASKMSDVVNQRADPDHAKLGQSCFFLPDNFYTMIVSKTL